MRLGARARAAGHRLEIFETAGSTNDLALAAACGKSAPPTWFAARAQSEGRGRQKRIWRSPAGNLYVSLALCDPCDIRVAPQLGFLAGVALAQAAQAIVGPRDGLGLKWPNDLLYGSAKLAGVLLESARRDDGRLAVAIGIGVNCQTSPQGLEYPTAALSDLHPGAGDPGEMLAELSDRFLDIFHVWDCGRNFEAVRQKWLTLCLGRGHSVRVRERRLEGRFETIDAQGRLILRAGENMHAIEAGDIMLVSAEK